MDKTGTAKYGNGKLFFKTKTVSKVSEYEDQITHSILLPFTNCYELISETFEGYSRSSSASWCEIELAVSGTIAKQFVHNDVTFQEHAGHECYHAIRHFTYEPIDPK